jgi:hypothetical protein
LRNALALTAATATLVAAAINLRIAWRREVLDRLPRTRGSPRARRGLLIAIAIVVIAAAVGGYAAALYVMQGDRQHARALRADLHQRIADIQRTAARLEQNRFNERVAIESETRLLESRRRGAEGAVALATLGPCPVRGADAPLAAPAGCSEADAAPSAVCVPIPADATVSEVAPYPYLRARGDSSDWPARRVALGSRAQNSRVGEVSERIEAGADKQVCVAFWSWDSQRALDVRLLVRYLVADPVGPPASSPHKVQAAVRPTP